MIKDNPHHSPAQIRELSEKWYARQIELLAACHGKDWETNREWLEDYLRADLRARLIALGWRPKK